MKQKFKSTFFSFIAGVLDTLINIHSQIFAKIQNDPNVILRGLGDID
jgi:hypothetical protein